ncbi:DNA internalization-related competence protein ComEC/Rec2 [Virgibacillus sp. DJP39]|uniref:DNA internalization-related competence protein ComEC/Rec2 n=1 Tax=Virgibacillus sp. DJP39 TaxID=3409790 RepID=UPI003BB61145
MKGYWHLFALSVLLSILTIAFNYKPIFIVLCLWLFYLYKQKRVGVGPILLSLLFYVGFYFYIPVIDQTVSTGNEEAINGQIQGTISSPVTMSSKRIEFVVKDQASEHKVIVLAFKEENMDWDNVQLNQLKYGATCNIKGLMVFPDRSRNPGQFNYRSYLFSKGINYQLKLSSLDNITCEGSSHLNSILEFRLSLINVVLSKTDPYTAKWLSALVLGDDSQLDEKTVELFKKWNLSHLLAISGLHVSLIITIIYYLLIKSTLLTKENAEWVMLLILPFYAILAGGEPSVWRACLMVLVFIILRKMKQIYSLTDVLSVLFILLILFNRYIPYHIGFQLSFLVTLGLLLSVKWISRTTSPLIISLQISFVAQMMIIPLQLAYFYTFQPLSILLNVFVVPYFSIFVIPFMFLILLLTPLPAAVLSVFGFVFKLIHQTFIYLIDFLDQVAYFPYTLGPMSVLATVVYYVFFLLFMDAIQKEKSKKAMNNGILIVLLITFIGIKPFLSPNGTVTMLDVGQGDSFIVELPYRKAVFFIDAGAKMSFENNQASSANYEQVIEPFLKVNGISKIDAIFATHEDVDHVGSVPYMIENYKVDRVFLSEYYNLPHNTIKKWQSKGIIVQRIKAGNEIDFYDFPIQLLAPLTDKKETNANSLVMHMKLGGLGWLFTGDIDKEIELELMGSYPELSFDVLKVAHHGSKSSTAKSFLRHFMPEYAWISAGENNSYGHPNKDVLKLLHDERIKIFRTDQDGAVQYHFTKEKGTFSGYLP